MKMLNKKGILPGREKPGFCLRLCMDKEKILKIATTRLESRKTHRIDLLRKMSGMDRDEFDAAITELAKSQKIELVGGDTSGMTGKNIGDLIKIDGTLFVNIVWAGPLPARARGKRAIKKRPMTSARR